jgi:hypothetical protein
VAGCQAMASGSPTAKSDFDLYDGTKSDLRSFESVFLEASDGFLADAWFSDGSYSVERGSSF